IGAEFGVGKDVTGRLGTAWRLPFGLGALLVGWLADKYGAKRLLVLYLLGCAATAFAAWRAESLPVLFAAMLVMGCFASIYHPAGLALISRETTPQTRGAALGWHGVVGSAGIALAPLAAGVAFGAGTLSWRQYYLVLIAPAVALALLLAMFLRDDRDEDAARVGRPVRPAPDGPSEDTARWRLYFLLVTIGAQSGFIYAAFMHFLPRYLDQSGLTPAGMPPESFRNYLTALVLTFAILGQAVAGRLARPGRLEGLQSLILLANVPCLVWVGFAGGAGRLWASCALALVHFMTQPVYNSLIAQYVPRARRSVSYGFSNMICFGIGALGPWYAGLLKDDRLIYGGLAGVAAAAAAMALWLRTGPVDKPAGQGRYS
ncbi:MAG TPA: MFS transporter, partial [Planctomycetaceae bacterium]|nr:MFS transporter [Planctomycetaceae bacterium]